STSHLAPPHVAGGNYRRSVPRSMRPGCAAQYAHRYRLRAKRDSPTRASGGSGGCGVAPPRLNNTPMRAVAWCVLALAVAGGLWLFLEQRRSPLPPDLSGLLAYVSDRSGANALYLRRLPRGADRRLTFLSEAVGEPAFSPDGSRIAFSAEGRIGVVSVASGDV